MSALTILVLAATVALSSAQFQSTATLYNSYGGTGPFVNLPNTQFVPDLAVYGFDNAAYSVCLTGTWLFFDQRNFNLNGNAAMEYVFEPRSACVDFAGLGGYVTSAKFVGSAQDYRQESITFYQNVFFQGNEEYAVNDLANLNLAGAISSLIVTGQSSWTVYDRPNYQGNAICLTPAPSPNYEPAFVEDTINTSPSIPHGTISSVRRGCFSLKSVTLATATKHGLHH